VSPIAAALAALATALAALATPIAGASVLAAPRGTRPRRAADGGPDCDPAESPDTGEAMPPFT